MMFSLVLCYSKILENRNNKKSDQFTVLATLPKKYTSIKKMIVKYFILEKGVHITLRDKRRLQRAHSHPISLKRRGSRDPEARVGDPVCPPLQCSE